MREMKEIDYKLLHAVPHLSPGVELSPFDSSNGRNILLVSSDGRSWTIAPALERIIRAIDGSRNTQQIIEIINQEKSTAIESRIVDIIWNDLLGMGIIVNSDKAGLPDGKKSSASKRVLTVRIPFMPAKYVLSVSKLFQYLYSFPVAVVLILFSVATQIYWGINGVWPSSYASNINNLHWLTVLLLTGIVYISHEVGHTSACTRFGGKCGEIGFGIYWIYPVLYADVTGAWKLPRMQRAVVDLGGIYFQCICAGLIIIWNCFNPSPIAEMAIFIINASLIPNLYPFLKMDGYWFLSDITGIPNLMGMLENITKIEFSDIKRYSNKYQAIIYTYCILTCIFISSLAVKISLALPKIIKSYINLLHAVSVELHANSVSYMSVSLGMKILMETVVLAVIFISGFKVLRQIIQAAYNVFEKIVNVFKSSAYISGEYR